MKTMTLASAAKIRCFLLQYHACLLLGLFSRSQGATFILWEIELGF
jgi:hypothetical protein